MTTNELLEKEQEVLAGLKNFQRATVEHIDKLFRKGQKRVLVADEVGLGKTLIARGCIAKTARLRQQEGDNVFKVVYVCSNQNIARKNISKLNVFGQVESEDFSNSRLSMQHLQIALKEKHAKDSFSVQLISLTPQTSFQMSSSQGKREERALMYLILKKLNEFKPNSRKLKSFLQCYVSDDSWERTIERYYDKINEIKSADNYVQGLLDEITQNHQPLITKLAQFLKETGKSERKNMELVCKLRMMFAEISIDRLQADLIIMDEFQRFKTLLSESNDNTDSWGQSEMTSIAKKFFGAEDTRILLLSATPYKLYSTPEEIEESEDEKHYDEFIQVMNFLHTDEHTKQEFKSKWNDFSNSLMKINDVRIENLKQNMQSAEEQLLQVMCRTERMNVMSGADYIDATSAQKQLPVSEGDVQSYIDINLVAQEAKQLYVPIDYVKSCPFLLSFMQNYALMNKIKGHYKNKNANHSLLNKKSLFVNHNYIGDYKPLPVTNARLELLKQYAFSSKISASASELMLWIPPSLPYYEPTGVYVNSEHFSKLIVFSSWEMVPRMIGGLISYESERLTIGALKHKQEKKRGGYFAEKQYPSSRLRDENEEILLYQSAFLAKLYNPISCMNKQMSLDDIRKEIKEKLNKDAGVKALLSFAQNPVIKKAGNWYLAALKVLEGENIADLLPTLGEQPDDLLDMLVELAIGSPGVCICRSIGKSPYNTLPRKIVAMFNSSESTAIIDMSTSNSETETYWKRVVRYCVEGNFQAMFDEYVHLIKEDARFDTTNDINEVVHEKISKNIGLQTATYRINTWNRNSKEFSTKGLRAHYAVGFMTQGDKSEEKIIKRTQNIQNAFNSPFRPFVLASTSIGQEGLDFHHYCRRIMHWNLPSNPIDLEQREGRINRYKCHSLRQNLAEKYKKEEFKKNVWDEIFEMAKNDYCPEGTSELMPFWCLGKDQGIKIERLLPMYPMSIDQQKYNRLIKILSLYRMTMGQARQEELVKYLFDNLSNPEELSNTYLNLCPFDKI